MTTRNGAVINMNPAGFRMLGYVAAEDSVIGKSFKDFFTSESDWLTVKDAVERNGLISNAEIDLKHKDDRSIRSLVSGSLDRGSSTGEDTIHFLVKDIEQRRLIEEQIAQADKLASLGLLSAGFAQQ